MKKLKNPIATKPNAPLFIAQNDDDTYIVTASTNGFAAYGSPAAALHAFADELADHPVDTQMRAIQLFEREGLASFAEALQAAEFDLANNIVEVEKAAEILANNRVNSHGEFVNPFEDEDEDYEDEEEDYEDDDEDDEYDDEDADADTGTRCPDTWCPVCNVYH